MVPTLCSFRCRRSTAGTCQGARIMQQRDYLRDRRQWQTSQQDVRGEARGSRSQLLHTAATAGGLLPTTNGDLQLARQAACRCCACAMMGHLMRCVAASRRVGDIGTPTRSCRWIYCLDHHDHHGTSWPRCARCLEVMSCLHSHLLATPVRHILHQRQNPVATGPGGLPGYGEDS